MSETINIQMNRWNGTDYDIILPQAMPDSSKADKVSSATSGNLAGLDANGNLTDSGKKIEDFATKNHKSTHAIGGTDALTPGDIGAATASHNHDSAYAAKKHADTHHTGGTDALAPLDIGAATRTSGTATLAAASWVGMAAPYTYAVAISGLTAGDVLDVKAVEGMDKAAADLIKEAWGKAIGYFLPQTSAGKLTFYASEKPAVAIPIYWRLIK